MHRRNRVGAAIVGLSVLASVVAYVQLPPGPIAVHWDASGTPDDFYSKAVGLALLPALSAGLLVLFEVAGVVALAGAVVPEAYLVYVLVGPVALAALYATVYSYLAYRRTETSA